jgi:hypothetical protein
MSRHVWHKCSPGCNGCQFCEGGLGWCTVCGAFEGQLLTTCPGYRLNEATLDACYRGNVRDLASYRQAIEHGATIRNGVIVWRKRNGNL